MKKLIYLFLLAMILSCDKNEVDCSAVTCLEAGTIVNLIDDTSKENFILFNMFDKENISIQNSDNISLDFNIDENTGILIIAKPNNSDTIEISIEPDTNLIISYDMSAPKTNNCCDFGELTNVQVQNEMFEIIEGVITVRI